jgi:hypothetical protein
MTPTFKQWDKMEDHFVNRTKRHINLVRKYTEKIESKYPKSLAGLHEQSLVHDASKFEEPEYSPYLHIAWKYKLQAEGQTYDPPSSIKDDMTKATEHHVKSNKHHPEYWTDQVNTINPDNRDAPPEEMVDASKMPDVSLAEMCADWMAMAEEKGTNPLTWAEKNVNIRWKFTEGQTKKIYEILNTIWKQD